MSAEPEALAEWKEAVIEACIVSCIGFDESDPHGTLRNLLHWETQIALDPAVSSQARALQRGQWYCIRDRFPDPGQLIVKRWKRTGAIWAGVYTGTAKDTAFDEWAPLP